VINGISKERAVGILLGLHIGDSLGATLEFEPPRNRENFHTEIVGGGSLNWKAGEPTDDTTMMLMLLESMVEQGEFDPYDISGKFMEWKATDPKDMGRTTYYAIENMIQGKPVGKWGMPGVFDQGNGSLMRCAPLALFDQFCFKLCREQAALTHAHPNCAICDFIFIRAIQKAATGVDKWEIYREALKTAHDMGSDVYSELKKVERTSWDQLPTTGFVLHTLAAAFWALLNTDNFESSLIEIVNRGDDADTCGAVTGALCAAYYGLEQIPIRWLDRIQEREKITDLVERHYGN
jgi:ADP-ribosyl-[dinitrogen reductase] hydrolase